MSDKQAFDYGAKIAELEQVVAKLQNESTPLDEAMRLHKTGKGLVKELQLYLGQAEIEIQKQTGG